MCINKIFILYLLNKMLDTALGFSLLVSTIITAIVYVVTRSKNNSEQEQKDNEIRY